MELQPEEADVLEEYLRVIDPLIGDERTRCTFRGAIKGIIASESLVCAKIARFSPEIACSHHGEKRVRRMVLGETTLRSDLSAESIVGQMQLRAQRHLSGESELWVMLDGSDLRKPHAQRMEGLMRVRRLDGRGLVNGYRTLNAIAVGKERRAIVYHRLFSSREEGFESEPAEVRRALDSIATALAPLDASLIYGLDAGLDDIAIWGHIWERGGHLVCRVCHKKRLVERSAGDGSWQQVHMEEAAHQLRELVALKTTLAVRKGRQTYRKLQNVTARVSACPLRVTYRVDQRTEGGGEPKQKDVWLVQVYLEGLNWEPWWLITDIPVLDAASATKVFSIYKQRWSIEDTFKVTKECLGWEEVQLLDLEGVRTLVAMGWLAAGFLYEMGVTFETQEIRILAHLGGWERRKDRPPGRIVLMRGLRHLLDAMAVDAVLQNEVRLYGRLPPNIAKLLGERYSQ